MKLNDKRYVIKMIDAVQDVVLKRIHDHASGSSFGGGLSSEGFDGGYLEALRDVEAALVHGYPSDHRGYWREAEDKR